MDSSSTSPMVRVAQSGNNNSSWSSLSNTSGVVSSEGNTMNDLLVKILGQLKSLATSHSFSPPGFVQPTGVYTAASLSMIVPQPGPLLYPNMGQMIISPQAQLTIQPGQITTQQPVGPPGQPTSQPATIANGSTQLEGVDVDETFSPVVKPDIIRTVLILAVSRHWSIHQLDTKFSMTDLGSLNYFLGISVTRDFSGIFLSQKKYAVKILERVHMVNCNPIRTSVATESKLGIDGEPVSDPTLYRSLVALKRILRYVCGTLDYGLQLFSSSTIDFVLYSDADWTGCPTTRRSTSGYCVFLGNNLLSWPSKRQPTLSRSIAEAKYRGVANAVAKTLRNLLRELHTLLSSATLVYYDNVSVVYLSSIPVQHQRTKYIEIDIHFVRDLVAAGRVRVLHVSFRY
uniref:Ribonuclease H-like domain-containing protein n=1 Tax=Tanacetum cinerariifolium TaxID=118510 RepID=A0A6L2L8G8_TANCI|nr:ribonuclease H-like domain-containing protein [Tanacetum cinerariifolium]